MHRTPFITLVAAVAVTLVLFLPASARTPAPAPINGTVTDAEGEPVSGALVQLINRNGVVLRESRSGTKGEFHFNSTSRTDLFLQARTATHISFSVPVTESGSVTLTFGAPASAALSSAEPATPPSRAAEIATLRQQMAALASRLEIMSRILDNLTPREQADGSSPEIALAFAPTDAQPTGAVAIPEPTVDQQQGIYGTPASGEGASDRQSKVRIGGYGSFRYEANTINPAPAIASHPQVQNSFNSFDFRRFVLTLDANPTKRLRFYTEIEFERLGNIEIERTALAENRGTTDRAGVRFIQEIEGSAGSEIAMEQAWVQFDFNDRLSARMGVILPPLGRFNTNHDDDAWDIPRRSLVDRGGPVLPVKAAWSELGVGVLGKTPVGKGYVDYQFYVVNGATLDFTIEEVVSLREGRNLLELEPEISFSSGPFNGTNTADAYTWRFGYAPRIGHELAISGYHGEYTPPYLLVDSWIHAAGVDGRTTFGNFEVEGEFVYTDFGQMEAALSDLAFQAVDAIANTSTGETATLESEVEAGLAGPMTNQRFGYWIDLKYRFWPRALDDSFLGKGFENPEFIPIVRFERIWFNDLVRSFDFSGGLITDLTTEDLSQQRTTLGIAYRPTSSVGFTVAYEHNRRMKGTTMISPETLGLGRVTDKTYSGLIIGSVFGF